MVAQGDGGRIVFSSSVTGLVAVPNLSAYAVTKAGLVHMAARTRSSSPRTASP